MRRKSPAAAAAAALALGLLLLAPLGGCGKKEAAAEPTEPAMTAAPAAPTEVPRPTEAPAVPTETAGSAEAEPEAGMADGERFETVIFLEGMEETVRYEHVRNEAAGFELDYDYESLVRRSEGERECFVSLYDRPEAPQNYLEVSYVPEAADAAAEAISAALSEAYDAVVSEADALERAGACLRISASQPREGKADSGSLQTVYVIPAEDGCRVAVIHCTMESAEGFGRRFAYLLNTLTVLVRQPGAD